MTVSKNGYETMTRDVTTSAGATTDMGTLSLKSDADDVAPIMVAIAAAAILLIIGFVSSRRKS